MIDADRTEFLELLGDLFGAHSQNLKAGIAGGYWKGLKHMTLGEFRARCEADLEKLQHAQRGVSRPPTVAELWDLHRTLKGSTNARETSSSETPRWQGDAWSERGGDFLRGHISRLSKPADLDYAPDSYYDGATRTVKFGEHTEAIAKILSRWMNAWVHDMRDAQADGTTIDGKAAWQHCMGEADRQVREYLERYVRRVAA